MNAFAFIRAGIVRSEIVGTGKLGSVSGGYRSRDDLFRDRRPIGGSDRRDVGCDIKFVVVSNGHVEDLSGCQGHLFPSNVTVLFLIKL